MPSLIGADIFIRGILERSAQIAYRCINHARNLPAPNVAFSILIIPFCSIDSPDYEKKHANSKATNYHFRSFDRYTNFNPDHVSSTAHTFTSTRPEAIAMLRITSSVRSVAAPEFFFGQEIQTQPP